MWQSLALLDYKQDIGVMKSKQMIRNEIFEKVAKIIIDEEAKETPETLAIYTKGGTNEQTEALKARILNRIDCIQEDYRDIANPEDINMAIAECRAEIV
jgi:dihydroxyacetone kinase-like predicted kinase